MMKQGTCQVCHHAHTHIQYWRGTRSQETRIRYPFSILCFECPTCGAEKGEWCHEDEEQETCDARLNRFREESKEWKEKIGGKTAYAFLG